MGYPPAAYPQYRNGYAPMHAAAVRNGPYYPGFDRQARTQLLGEAEKLKMRELEEKKKLDEHKAFLQNDLKFHLAPNGNANKNADVNTVPEKHKLLFESLKGPKHSNLGRMNGQKKSAQPPLRVHKDLIDRIGSPPIAKCDTDSTMSTITAKSTQNDESENESLKVPEDEEEERTNATCKDAIVPLEGGSGSAGRKRKPQHLL